MMRRRLTIAATLLVVGVLTAVLVGPASSAPRKSDVTVSDLAEPPDFSKAGRRFRESFTVANMGTFRAGRLTVRRFSTTRFFLDKNPNNRKGRLVAGKAKVSGIAVNSETSRRAQLRVPRRATPGNYFLVACADATNRLRESNEKNNCRVSGQSTAVGISRTGPPGAAGSGATRVDRFALPLGRPTVDGFFAAEPGDDEKSDQRRDIASVGPVRIVADCKRTSNGDNEGPDAATTAPGQFDEDGDEAKILVYTDSGTLTFNSLGESSRRNIPAGEGQSEDQDPDAGAEQFDESNGGEGGHMAIAAARDPDQTAPEEDWAFGYKVGTIFIQHSNGTQLIFTGYAGIDVLGIEDQCVFGGTLKVVRQPS
jgi:hypothetical protein